jgi:hypothetical protein
VGTAHGAPAGAAPADLLVWLWGNDHDMARAEVETVCGRPTVVVAGAAQNVASLGLDRQITVRQRDARAWGATGRRFDAVVADLPYGRVASTKGSDRVALYRDFLDVAAQILRPGGRAVLMAPEGALPMPPACFEILWRFREVVHRSLTREVTVLAKRGGESACDGGPTR